MIYLTYITKAGNRMDEDTFRYLCGQAKYDRDILRRNLAEDGWSIGTDNLSEACFNSEVAKVKYSMWE